MTLIIAIFGLIFGSFIAALTWRLPRGISIAKGRSLCPKCKHEISWFDNIPVVSYLLLRGRCRHCHRQISFRYPIIELSTAIGLILIYLVSGNFFYLVVFLITLAIFVCDVEHQIIPDELIFAGLGFVFVYYLLISPSNFYLLISSAFFCSFFLLFLHLLTHGRGMGLGDVKLALLLGFLLLFPNNIYWLSVSFVLGAVVGLILMAVGRAGLKTKIAFGPFLIVGFWLTKLWINGLLF